MTEMKYQMAFCLTAAFVLSTALAATTTSDATVSSTETTMTSTASESTASAETTTTTEATTTVARNISCNDYTCEYNGCIQNATDNNAIGNCFTSGYCFARLTSNSTYTKEELGCEATISGCLTSVHTNNGGQRICCTSADCNSITPLKQSTAPSLSYSLGAVLLSLLFSLGKF
ncbi:uncharacterized protein LOC133200190 [Saccostrea echinata]|uniref:uncharacterized protein LOC133200190 n=1 Tax=Saccostrea echinata TaxID=191078 RepID=UPI002A82D32C|nr:uncharacterized protein LOC133200190 [Saccostrea echinata]XP_061191978.1 uncharacterized protein LOC133200190 [Saccostrea echinata]